LKPGWSTLICRSAEADTTIPLESSVNLKANLGIKKPKINLPNDVSYENVDEIVQGRILKIPSQESTYAIASSLSTGLESKEANVKMIMKLKEKTTNAVVKPALVGALPLQTPEAHSVEVQIPKTPLKKKAKADISFKQSPSPPRHRARPSFTGTGPVLEDQCFPNIQSPSASKEHSKHHSILTANSANITTAASQRPVHKPRRSSGISDQILVKGPNLSFLEKAKEVVTDTAHAAVKFLPDLVRPKAEKAPKQKARVTKIESLDSTVRSKLKAFGKGTNIRSREYEEVVDPTDSEDHREGNITRTWKDSLSHRILGADESHQNLLHGPTHEGDAGEGEATVGSPETSEASDMKVITDGNNTFKSSTAPRSKISGKRLGKHTKNRHRQQTFNDDTEQGFDGDVEMLTGEDDYDLDENPELNTEYSSRGLGYSFPWAKTPHKDSDCGATLTIEDNTTTGQLDVDMTDIKSRVCTPLRVKKYDEVMAMEIGMATKKRTLENSPIRSSYSVKRKYSTFKKVSLIGEPPGDLSNLSEDELCSPNYMVVPFAARYDQNKTPSKTRNIKGKTEARAIQRVLKPDIDRMETD